MREPSTMTTSVSNGNPGSPGADITVLGRIEGGGRLHCICDGGNGGAGGQRGPGKVHSRPGGKDPWKRPGDPYRTDVGPTGPPGHDGHCVCPSPS